MCNQIDNQYSNRLKVNIDGEQNVQIKHLDWLSASDKYLGSIAYDTIIGSDLTYTLDMLLPLAQLLQRLINLKKPSPTAWIACTQRGSDSISAFLKHVNNVGLHFTLVTQLTTSEYSVVSHEPIHKVFVNQHEFPVISHKVWFFSMHLVQK